MSSSRLGRMASVALEDGDLKRLPSKEKDPLFEGAKNLHLNPNNPSFVLSGPKPTATQQIRGSADDEALSEDLEDEDEEQDSVYACFSSRNPITRWSANFFGGTATPAYMSLFTLALFMVMTFQNLTADSRSSSIAFMVYFGINILMLLGVFILRAIWFVILYWVFEENRIVPALNEIIDPDLPILIWTLLMHTLWASNMAQVFDTEGRKTGYHRIRFLPDDWPFQSIKDQHVTYLKLMQFVLIFWAVRNLLVEVIMFNILLGFLTNFRDAVLSYLSEYALLRKLNANWIKVVPPNETSPREESRTPPPQPLIRRHSSLSIAFEEAVSRHPQLTTLANQSSMRLNRAYSGNIWERRRRRRARAVHVQHTGRELPTVLQNKNIQAVRQSALANLLSITFIRMNPMVLFVHGERCELKSRKVTKAVARLLFREIQEFQQHVNDINEELLKAEKALVAEELAAFAALQSPNVTTGTPHHSPTNVAPASQRPHTPVPEASPTPPPPPDRKSRFKINIQEPASTFTDRLAAELGVRNEEGQDDDETDEDVSDGERLKVIQEAVEGKPHKVKLPTPVTTPQEARSVPVIDDTVDVKRPEVRRHTAPGFTAFNFHPPVFEKPRYERLTSEAPDVATEQEGQKKQFSSTPAHGSSMRRSHSLTSESDSLEAFAEYEAPLMPLHDTEARTDRNRQERSRMTQEQVNRVAEAEIRAVNKQAADTRTRITKEFFSVFMSKAETESLMAVMDPARNGSVTEKMFVKGVLNVHQKRRQMCSSLDAQKEIIGVFHRVTTYFLTFIMFLIFLLIAGVSTNTIIVSGAAALSASGVVLSFVYTDFIISIILIVFLNPYSIGDGIVLNGVFMTVRRITTYFTECVQGDGKIFYVSHKKLTETGIINQSRGTNAVFGLTVRVGDHMTAAQYAAFKKVIEAYLKSRPDMYKPGLFIHWLNLEPWHFIDLNMWITGMESWSAPGTWIAKSDLFAFVLRQTHILGLTYKGVIQRWQPYEDPEEKPKLSGSGEAPHHPILMQEAHHSYAPPPTPSRNVMFLDLTKPLDRKSGEGHVSFM